MNNTSIDRSKVLSEATIEAARRLKINSTDLALIIGSSKSTSLMLMNAQYLIQEGSMEWELSTLFVHLFRSLLSHVGGDDDLAAVWMVSKNEAFNFQEPISYVKRVDGLKYTCEYLDTHLAS